MTSSAILRALALLPLCAFLCCGKVASAQTTRGAVPQGELPTPVPTPVRDGVTLAAPTASGESERQAAEGFAQAYQRQGKPKIAVAWNDRFSQADRRWTSDTRLVERHDSTHYGSDRSVVEVQRRRQAAASLEADPPFEWEFQDGFLGVFLAAGVTLLDRGLSDEAAFGEQIRRSSADIQALKGRAEYVLEIFPLANRRSTAGYEMQVRIFDAASGALVSLVNSRNLASWNRSSDEVELTPRGYRLRDPDEQGFGPLEERRFVVGPNGYVERQRAQPPFRVGQEMAYAAMTALMQKWQ